MKLFSNGFLRNKFWEDPYFIKNILLVIYWTYRHLSELEKWFEKDFSPRKSQRSSAENVNLLGVYKN